MSQAYFGYLVITNHKTLHSWVIVISMLYTYHCLVSIVLSTHSVSIIYAVKAHVSHSKNSDRESKQERYRYED